jgi:hypothetical protein
MESVAIIGGLFYVAIIVLMIVSMWKVFEKAGEPGWASIIPIYNLITLLKIVGKPWWWLFLMCIPFLNIIWVIWSFNLLSKSFGQSEGFTVGLVLLGIVFFPILAFGDYTYQGPAGGGQVTSLY